MSTGSSNPYANVLKSKGVSPVIEPSKDTYNAREETTPKQPAFANVKLRSVGDKSPVVEEVAKPSLSPAATSVGSETPKTPAFASVKLRSVGGSAYSTPQTSDSQKTSEQNSSTGKDILSTGSKKESSEAARLSRTSGNKLAAFLNAVESSPSSPSDDNKSSVEVSKTANVVKEAAKETPSVPPRPTISTPPPPATVSTSTSFVADAKKMPSTVASSDNKKIETPSSSGSETVSPFGVKLKSTGSKPADFAPPSASSDGSASKSKVESTASQTRVPEKTTPSSSSSAPFQVKLRSVGSKPADFASPTSASKVEVASSVTNPAVDEEKRSPVVVTDRKSTPVTMVASASKMLSSSAKTTKDEKPSSPFPIKLRSVADKPADFVEGPTSSVSASKPQKEETSSSPFGNVKLRSAGEKPADFVPESQTKSTPQATPEPEKNKQQSSPVSSSAKSPFAAFAASASSENKQSEAPAKVVPQSTVVKPVAKVEKSPVEKPARAEPASSSDASKSPFTVSLRAVAEKPADFTEGPTSKNTASKTKAEDTAAVSPVFTAVKLRSTSDGDLPKPVSPKSGAPESPAFAAAKLPSTSDTYSTTSKPMSPKGDAPESPAFAAVKLRSTADVDLKAASPKKEAVELPAFADVKLRSTSDADKAKSVESTTSRDGSQSPSSPFAAQLRSVNNNTPSMEHVSAMNVNKETPVSPLLSVKLRSNSDAKQESNEIKSNPASPSSASASRTPTLQAKAITETENKSSPFARFLSQPSTSTTTTSSPLANPAETTSTSTSFSLGGGAKQPNDSKEHPQEPARVLSVASSTKDEPDKQSSIVQHQPSSQQQQKSPTNNKLSQFLGQSASGSKDETQPVTEEPKPKTSSWTPTQKSTSTAATSGEPEKKRSAAGWTPTQRSSTASLPSEQLKETSLDMSNVAAVEDSGSKSLEVPAESEPEQEQPASSAMQDSGSKSPVVAAESEPKQELPASPVGKSALSGFLAELEPSVPAVPSTEAEKPTPEEVPPVVLEEDAPTESPAERITNGETEDAAVLVNKSEQEIVADEEAREDATEADSNSVQQHEEEKQQVHGKPELRLDTSMNPDDDVDDDDDDEEDYRTVRNIIHRRRTSPRDNKIAKAVAKLREQQQSEVNRGMFVGGRGHRLGAIEETEDNIDEEEAESQHEEVAVDDQPVLETASSNQAEENEDEQQILDHHVLSRPIVPPGQRRRPSRSSTDEYIEHIAQQRDSEKLDEEVTEQQQQRTGSTDMHDETTTDETVELSRSAGPQVDQGYHSDEREPQDVVGDEEEQYDREGRDEMPVDGNEAYDHAEEEEQRRDEYYGNQEPQVTDEYPNEDGRVVDQADADEGQYEHELSDAVHFQGKEEQQADHGDYMEDQEQQTVEEEEIGGENNEVSLETLEQALERVLNDRDQLALELDEERKTVAEAADLVKSMEIDQMNLQDRIAELEAIVAELENRNPSAANRECEKCKTRDAADAKGLGLTKAALVLAAAVIVQILLLAIGM